MRPARLLHAFTAAVSATILAALTAFAVWDHQSSRQEAERSLREVTRLMEEHTRAAMLAGALQLNRVENLVGDRPLASLKGSVADWAALKRIMGEMPHADSVWVFDDRADLVLSTLKPQAFPLNVADRAYFQAVRDGADLFISPRIWGKVYGGYYFAMSRPLMGRDGSLKGVAQFSVKESYFSDFYRTLRPEGGGSFTILKTDGTLVTRFPEPARGQPVDAGSLRQRTPQLAEGEVRTLVLTSIFDQVERLYGFRRVVGHPLYVVAGLPTTTVFAGWRERTLRNGALAIVMLAALFAVSWQLRAAFRGEAEARAKAQALLADKEVLFQEIHHRVKNNLQIIASFLTMQAIKADTPATAASFQEALDRIHSMGLVHQTLYEQNEASEVSMDAYLRALADSVGPSYGASDRDIAIKVLGDGIRLKLDRAVPLALLANEALTNALKHAFPGDRAGRIEMSLTRDGDRLTFAIADDGIGIPEGEAVAAGPGLGMHILKALSRQLDGSASFGGGIGGGGAGTRITVAFPA